VEVTGTADSLPALIDRLSAQLLARAAGQTEQRLADLTSTSLPAVRAYLNGQAAYRQGRYAEATEQYGRALDLDSTFALAAVGLAATGYWSGELSQRAVALSWAGRDRLNFRDRALAIAFAGPRFPAETPLGERRLAWEKAVKVAPDRPEAWFFLGDWYFHFGALTGFAGSDERASACFRRALELDPRGEAPLAHLVELAAFRGDSAEAGQLAKLFLAADSAGDVADFIRWRVAVVRDDSAVLSRLRARFDGMATASLVRIVQASQESGVALGDADHAAEVLRGRVGTVEGSLILAALALNRGRPATHSRMIATLRDPAQAERDHLSLRVQVASALFGDGDTTTATKAFAELARHAGASLARDSAARDQQMLDICLVELWRLGHHEMGTVDQAIHRLRAPAGADDSAEPSMAGATCALILEAVLASNGRGADAVQAFDRLDSILVAGVLPPYPIPANLILAQVRSSLDPRRALDAVRRRGRWTTVPLDDYLSTYLREEGRLAALAGDREGAVRAYQHYLALRSTPEPSLAPEVTQVRATLANLIKEPR
jgi:Tfp pilus assembly protein PilF